MRLPTWDELIPLQRSVLEHPLDQPLFVAGPPGSGKTVVAIRRAQMLRDGNHSVTMVTYTIPQSRPRWHHLVVDEGQDLPAEFFYYASRHAAGALTVFADEDQAVGDRRTTLEQIKAAAGLPDPVILQENHRNTPEIARVAEHFHSGRLPAATVRRQSIKQVPRLIWLPSTAETAGAIARWLQNRGGTIGVVVDRNNTGVAVQRELRTRLPNHRVDFYTSELKNEDSIELLRPGVTIVNKQSVKGQEFDTVFVLEIENFIPCTTDAGRRVLYMVCTRGRDHLFFVHGPGPLSPAANAALPNEQLLRRG